MLYFALLVITQLMAEITALSVPCPVLIEHPQVDQVDVGSNAPKRVSVVRAGRLAAVSADDASHMRTVTIFIGSPSCNSSDLN